MQRTEQFKNGTFSGGNNLFTITFGHILTTRCKQGMVVAFEMSTALRNHMRIVFKEMSSWTPLTMYLGMKTTSKTKYIICKFVRIFIMMIFYLHNIIRKCILTLKYYNYYYYYVSSWDWVAGSGIKSIFKLFRSLGRTLYIV